MTEAGYRPVIRFTADISGTDVRMEWTWDDDASQKDQFYSLAALVMALQKNGVLNEHPLSERFGVASAIVLAGGLRPEG